MQIGNLPARQADQKHMHDAAELIGRGGGENKYFCLWSVKAPPPFMPFISFLKHFGTINILPLHCVGFVGGGGGGSSHMLLKYLCMLDCIQMCVNYSTAAANHLSMR